MNNVEAYFDLLHDFQQGLYTQSEVVEVSINLLYESTDRDALWQAFLQEHRDSIKELLIRFNESDPPFALNADPVRAWHTMLTLKKWLMNHAGASKA